MEPTTAILLISIPALLAGIGLCLQRKNEERKKIIKIARERAKQRIVERDFVDTTPNVHQGNNNISDATIDGLTVVESGVNSYGIELTDEQARTIDLIFQGLAPPVQHRPVHRLGANVHIASGVPLNLTALSDTNSVQQGSTTEYLDPDYKWPEAQTHGQ